MASEANKVMNCNDHQICWRVHCSLLVVGLLLGLQRIMSVVVDVLVVDELQPIGAVALVAVVVVVVVYCC